MPLVSHEIPESLFPYHDLFNDYPYILGHLVSDNNYTNFYIRNVAKHDFSILDNGLHELGRPMSTEELIEVVDMVKPSHLVLPDYLNDYEKTISASRQCYNSLKHNNVNVKIMAVAQGKDFEEMKRAIHNFCFSEEAVLNEGGVLAIPFRCSAVGHPNLKRAIFFKKNLDLFKRVANLGIRIHFLGCEDAGEFALYTKEELDLIYSLDTSAPIIHGWLGHKLEEGGGISPKPKQKLADHLDIEFDEETIELIVDNIKTFRGYLER